MLRTFGHCNTFWPLHQCGQHHPIWRGAKFQGSTTFLFSALSDCLFQVAVSTCTLNPTQKHTSQKYSGTGILAPSDANSSPTVCAPAKRPPLSAPSDSMKWRTYVKVPPEDSHPSLSHLLTATRLPLPRQRSRVLVETRASFPCMGSSQHMQQTFSAAPHATSFKPYRQRPNRTHH